MRYDLLSIMQRISDVDHRLVTDRQHVVAMCDSAEQAKLMAEAIDIYVIMTKEMIEFRESLQCGYEIDRDMLVEWLDRLIKDKVDIP